jgi:hypothetical protein
MGGVGMIRVQYDPDLPGYHIESLAPSDPMERVRHLGFVQITSQGFHVRISSGKVTVANQLNSLPAAIHELIDFHKMTDYQYAPWPTMEEDEE